MDSRANALSLGDAMRYLAVARAEGVLTVSSAFGEACFFLSRGELVGATSSRGHRVGRSLLDEPTLELVLALQRRKKRRERIGRIVADLRLATESEVREALRDHCAGIFAEAASWNEGSVRFEPEPVPGPSLRIDLTIEQMEAHARAGEVTQ